jgi:hypothetical protein
MHELNQLRDTLCKNLEEYGRKNDLKAGDLDVVDKLTHTIKNLDKVIEKYDDEYSGARGRNARRDSMGRYAGEYSNEAMARGNRGDYNDRGRYSNRYSNTGGMVMELRELMEDAPDERTRMEFEKFIRKMENM